MFIENKNKNVYLGEKGTLKGDACGLAFIKYGLGTLRVPSSSRTFAVALFLLR